MLSNRIGRFGASALCVFVRKQLFRPQQVEMEVAERANIQGLTLSLVYFSIWGRDLVYSGGWLTGYLQDGSWFNNRLTFGDDRRGSLFTTCRSQERLRCYWISWSRRCEMEAR
jgi:hypothetical protein